MRRLTARVCTGTGAAALVAAFILPATAQATVGPGEGFGSFNLAANAPVVQIRFDDGSNCSGNPSGTAGCEGTIPETVSTLRNGPIGYGLSSILWPGTLAGNLGSLLLAANPSAPSQARMLNSPVRAESRTGSGPDTVTNSDYPGTTMTATATDDAVSASAVVASSASVSVGTFGSTSSSTSVELTGPALAVAKAASQVNEISLADGAVTIGSVSSTVLATTDGVKAAAKGRTIVSDLRIGGQSVTVDDKGITLAGQNNPLNKTASAAVNTVISNLGMYISISEASGTPERGTLVYNAGSLVIAWMTPGGAATAIFGGANVALRAVPDSGGNNVDVGTETEAAAPVNGSVGTVTGARLPSLFGDSRLAAPSAAVTVAPGVPGSAAAQQPGLLPSLASQRLPLPGPPSPAYAVVGLLGVSLLFAGLRQVPDRVLDTKGSTCLTEESV